RPSGRRRWAIAYWKSCESVWEVGCMGVEKPEFTPTLPHSHTPIHPHMKLEDRGRNIWATVTADMQRYAGTDCRPWSPLFFRRLIRAGYEHPGLLAVLVFRFGQWIEFRCRIPILRQVCDAYYYYL